MGGEACDSIELLPACHIHPCRRALPFRLGRQPRPRPGGIGIGLIQADVTHRRCGVDRAPAMQPELLPAPRHLAPIERRGNPLALHPCPAIGQPVARLGIAAVIDEGAPFGVAHRTAGDLVRGQQHLMARSLAVEGKAAAVMADLDHAGCPVDPCHRRGLPCLRRVGHVGVRHRRHRILREQMQQIGQQQFLMLLFMRDAQRHQIARACRQQRHRLDHRHIHRRAPIQYLGKRRPRQQPPRRPRMARTLSLIVTVEQERKPLVMQPISRHMITQQECLEEPGRMRQMPFCWAGVGHRLRAGIGVGQWCDQRRRQIAGGAKARTQAVRFAHQAVRDAPGTHRTSPAPLLLATRAATNSQSDRRLR